MARFACPVAVLACAMIITACSPKERAAQDNRDAELERLAARAARVEIIRDDFGVLRVYGKIDADAVFGMLYTQSQDDFSRIERNCIRATGWLGEAAIFDAVRPRGIVR